MSASLAWAAPDPVLSGQWQTSHRNHSPGTFVASGRTWKDGDRVELELPCPCDWKLSTPIIRNLWPWCRDRFVAVRRCGLSAYIREERALASQGIEKCCGRLISTRLMGAASPASIHEHRQGKLQHVLAAEVLKHVRHRPGIFRWPAGVPTHIDRRTQPAPVACMQRLWLRRRRTRLCIALGPA